MRLTAKQTRANRLARHRLNIWEGSVRSGKTHGSVVEWVRFIRTAPKGNLLMVGKTERTLARNIIDPMVEMLGSKRCVYNQGRGELYVAGRRVYVAGANDERAQDKIRGLTLVGFYADEISVLPESFWSMLLSRISVTGARGFGTTNPDSPNHWLKKEYLDRARVHLDGVGNVHTAGVEDRSLDLARFSFRLTDNPHLDPEYVIALQLEYTGLWHRRFILGEWVIAKGAVYDNFNPEKHVIRGALPPLDRMPGVGIDYGTTNPFSAIALGMTAAGKLIAVSEWRHDPAKTRRQLTDSGFSIRVREWMKTLPMQPSYVAVDPSAASFKLQLNSDNVRGMQNAKNEVLDGIRLVASLMDAGKLLIHESCVGLLDELPGYSWDDKAAEKGEDKPLKVNDHSCDALRYAVLTTRPVWHNKVKGIPT